MKKEDFLFYKEDLNLFKGKKGLPIGTEKQWGNQVFVKTTQGWKPKGKMKGEKKPEVAPEGMKKPEDPNKQRIKQLEDFAAKASDNQLEAAIKDPKQEQEVKDIAQAELDKRNKGSKPETEDKSAGEKTESEKELPIKESIEEIKKLIAEAKATLTKELESKKEEAKKEPIKQIKKTGIMLDGHKIFIIMNKDNTGYKTQGLKALKLESKEGESLSDFKERIKAEWKKLQTPEPEKEEVKEEPKKKKDLSIKEEYFGDATKDLYKKAKKDNSLLPDLVDMLVESDFPKKDILEFIKEEFDIKDGSKSDEFYRDYLNPKVSSESKEKDTSKELSYENLTKEQQKIFNNAKENQFSMIDLTADLVYDQNYPDKEIFDFIVKNFDPDENTQEWLKDVLNIKKTTLQDDIEQVKEDPISVENQIAFWKATIEKAKSRMDESFKKQYEYEKEHIENSVKNYGVDFFEATDDLDSLVDRYSADGRLGSLVALSEAMMEKGMKPYCSPLFFEEYKGQQYNVLNFNRGFYTEQSKLYKKPEGELKLLLEAYVGSEYHYFTHAALGDPEWIIKNADMDLEFSKNHEKEESVALLEPLMEIINNAKNEGEKRNQILAYMKEKQNLIDTFIDEQPSLSENIAFSRRIDADSFQECFSSLKPGDIGTFKPMQSFSFAQIDWFGEAQITLLAKKGERMYNIDNPAELEYLTKSNTKFRVIASGYNSMAIQLV